MYSANKDDLNDLYQDIVVNLWHSFPNFRNECQLSTWIYRIALNTCITELRQHKRKMQFVPLEMSDEFYKQTEENALLQEMYLLINQLEPLDKTLILLWLDGNTYDEISDIAEISKSNVAIRINRIKKRLKKMSNN